jgi:cytosine/adenosine deaminase-related metal-dependent hydrolase
LSTSGVKIIQAKWVAPMDRPILRDAAVAIDAGKIVTVDSAASVRKQHPHAEVVDLPRSVLLPGLINAHVHLELSDCECGASPGGTFGDWILSLRDRTRIDAGNPERSITDAVKNGIAQCLRFGVTCIGDITSAIEISRGVLSASPLRGVTFGEALGLGKLRPRFDSSLQRATNVAAQSERLRIGISPHAPYTVDLPGYQECLTRAKQFGLPLATHLAESAEEEAFLKHHTGMFREIWNKLGLWDDNVVTYPASPIAFAKSIGLLDYPTVLAHVNYCTDTDLNLLANGTASVVYCPRTHAYFGHPPHRWREMMAKGINVAVGTDSCASSPNLNLLDDLRLLRKIAPEVPVETIWQMATTRAARTLMLHDVAGSLSAGKSADIIAFETTGDAPLEELLSEMRLPQQMWIARIAQDRSDVGGGAGGGNSTPA